MDAYSFIKEKREQLNIRIDKITTERNTGSNGDTEGSIQDLLLAINRIDNNDYLICAECNDIIQQRRLNVVPTTILCSRCASRPSSAHPQSFVEQLDELYRCSEFEAQEILYNHNKVENDEQTLNAVQEIVSKCNGHKPALELISCCISKEARATFVNFNKALKISPPPKRSDPQDNSIESQKDYNSRLLDNIIELVNDLLKIFPQQIMILSCFTILPEYTLPKQWIYEIILLISREFQLMSGSDEEYESYWEHITFVFSMQENESSQNDTELKIFTISSIYRNALQRAQMIQDRISNDKIEDEIIEFLYTKAAAILKNVIDNKFDDNNMSEIPHIEEIINSRINTLSKKPETKLKLSRTQILLGDILRYQCAFITSSDHYNTASYFNTSELGTIAESTSDLTLIIKGLLCCEEEFLNSNAIAASVLLSNSAHKLLDNFLRDNPQNVEALRLLAICYRNTGQFLARQYIKGLSLVFYETSLKIFDKLLTNYKDSAELIHGKTLTLCNIGYHYIQFSEENTPALTTEYLLQAHSNYTELLKSPKNSLSYKHEYSCNLRALGIYHESNSNYKTAEEYYNKSLRICNELLQKAPNLFEFKLSFAITGYYLGHSKYCIGEFGKAYRILYDSFSMLIPHYQDTDERNGIGARRSYSAQVWNIGYCMKEITEQLIQVAEKLELFDQVSTFTEHLDYIYDIIFDVYTLQNKDFLLKDNIEYGLNRFTTTTDMCTDAHESLDSSTQLTATGITRTEVEEFLEPIPNHLSIITELKNIINTSSSSDSIQKYERLQAIDDIYRDYYPVYYE